MVVNTAPAHGPIEGEWFEVNPSAINRDLFKGSRSDSRQERTRQLIREAFEEWDSHPEKYGGPFETMFPEKTRSVMTVQEMEDLASRLGDEMADWVHQSLEWAQRIANGESWEDVCNKPDTAKWYRLVRDKGKNWYWWVSGSRRILDRRPASDVDSYHFTPNYWIIYTVVLAVRSKRH